MSNRDRAERIVHALDQYLTIRAVALKGIIANPERSMDESQELLVQEIEKSLNEVVTEAT